MSNSGEKPVIWKAIFFSLLLYIFFSVLSVFFLAVFVFVLGLLSHAPILSALVDLFFNTRGDSPTIFALFVTLTATYSLTKKVSRKLLKHPPTRTLSVKILGLLIAAVQIVLFFANMFNEDPSGYNFVIFLCGIAFYFFSSFDDA